MFWKRKGLIAIIAIAGSAAGVGIVFALPAVYRSEAVILVDSQKIPERYVATTVNTDVQDRLATISQRILSTTRLQKIIDAFDLYAGDRQHLAQEEVIERMRRDISIKLERGWTGDRPGAFRVGYQGADPRLVTEVTNQIANLFIDENLRTRERQAEGTADFIDSQLNEAKNKLDELEAKVTQYKLEHSGELPQQENSLNATLARLQVELGGNQDAINRAQQEKLMLQNALDAAEASQTALARAWENTTRTGADPDEASPAKPAPKRSETLQQQYDALRLRYQPKNPDLLELKAEIERQKRLEDKEAVAAQAAAQTGAPPALTASLPEAKDLLRERERVENMKSQLALAQREMTRREEDRQRILSSIANYQARIEKLPVREQQMAALTRDYEISKANYKSLLDKKLAAGMATEMERQQQGERFTLLDAARVPGKPASPNRQTLSIGVGLLVLVVAVAAALAREMMTNVILGEWEIAPDMLILGRVPTIEYGSRDSVKPVKARKRWRMAAAASLGLATIAAGVTAVHFGLGWF